MLKIVDPGQDGEQNESVLDLDELCREGARRMLVAALEQEVAAHIAKHQDERDADGHRLVVRNGQARPRRLTCGAGTMTVAAPRVNDKRVDDEGRRQRFSSDILPRYMRKTPKVAEVLPVLYLRGLSSGDFADGLSCLLGKDASGLSASGITRLTTAWEKEYQQFRNRSFKEKDIVYIWADGVHFKVRLEDDRLCALVVLGVRIDGTKELIAVEDGYRESTESWKELLRDLKRRGLGAPAIAIGDGALGFWAALRDIYPETRQQRDWCHKMVNVLDKLPKRLQPKAKRMLREAMYADTKKEAQNHINAFDQAFSVKHPKAAACLTDDQDALLSFYDFPAQHWRHLRTSNPIESSFSTVRLRQRVTKGAGTRTKALTMAFKLLDMAQQRWRRITAPELLHSVRAGVVFQDGIMKEVSSKNGRKKAA